MVREAIAADVPRLVELGQRFFDETDMGQVTTYDPQSAGRNFAALLTMENAGVFVLDVGGEVVGVIAGLLAPYLFNAAELTGMELLWYVEPEHRGNFSSLRLVRVLEEWARQQGAATFAMAAMMTSPAAVADFYQRRGYRPQETHFVRRF